MGLHITCDAVVEVKRRGETVFKEVGEGDILTHNFGKLLMYTMHPFRFNGLWKGTEYFTDNAGNKRVYAKLVYTLNDLNSGVTPQVQFFNASDAGIRIAIGQGTTAPTRGDYKLENEIVRFTPHDIYYDESNARVEAYGSWTADMNYTISETGLVLMIQEYRYNDQSGRWEKVYSTAIPVLLARYVLSSPVTVGVGDVVTVRYRINLG